MLRRLSINVLQARGLKHKVKFNWVRPEYVPSYKPEKSGDLEPVKKIPPSAFGKDYSLSDEMKDASEAVRKLFSVEFLGEKSRFELITQELIDRVRRHEYDHGTAETKIARLTGRIRYFQEVLEKCPKNVRVKVICQELIDKRKKLLKFLRQYDYKKFEWILEQLNIEYKGHPDTYNKLSRKESLKKLTEMHCEDICNKKFAEYRNLLESQQGPFLKEKLEALKFIRSEQVELQLPVTITEQDIEKVSKQFDEWKIKDDLKQQAKKKKRNLIEEV